MAIAAAVTAAAPTLHPTLWRLEMRKNSKARRQSLGEMRAPSKKRKAGQQELGFMSELDREYFAIVGKPESARNVAGGGAAEPANKVPHAGAKIRASRKKNTSQCKPRTRRRTVHVACTRCDYEERMDKVEFGYASRRTRTADAPSAAAM